ncbi:tyrosine-protein phosphatase 2 [Dendryphion nanum]|uniref:Tyrosine-protein phosphatase 2 n=1 Tax=Dendryphion nanum TaxID=256645 RepID=A0A9P9EHK4_9PLEO|nr:tyrosine-protein phosphatase 2 [Dendryphion nanum]
MSLSSAPLAVPVSPSSSKRSRSRDSSNSAATSSIANTPAANTPSASAPSLVIPQPGSQTSFLPDLDPTPYPAFLRKSRADIRDKFQDLEWRQRDRLQPSNGETEQTSQFLRCVGDDVASRNRYANVDPYQSNRVKLQVPEGHSDYINASPIVLESTKSKKLIKFIATQGPKFESVSHLWRMIWNETASPAVIVMLTKTHETGREKCFPYYPRSTAAPDLKLNAHDEFEDGLAHTLHLSSIHDNDDVSAQVREIDMTTEDGSQSKKVWHLLFEGWPDFAVPEGAHQAALGNLIEFSRVKNDNNTENPRIVHCSAGVGRSGTFIALDWLLQELEEGSLDDPDIEDPIPIVVDKLRDQRMMMVQGEIQYIFLYDVLRERWRERWAKLHPEEAERLGVNTALQEPKPKKAKPNTEIDVSGSDQSGADEDLHAELEAELAGAQLEFEKGKT